MKRHCRPIRLIVYQLCLTRRVLAVLEYIECVRSPLPFAVCVYNKNCQLYKSRERDGVSSLEAVLAVNVKETSHLLFGIRGLLLLIELSRCRSFFCQDYFLLAVDILSKAIVSLLCPGYHLSITSR